MGAPINYTEQRIILCFQQHTFRNRWGTHGDGEREKPENMVQQESIAGVFGAKI